MQNADQIKETIYKLHDKCKSAAIGEICNYAECEVNGNSISCKISAKGSANFRLNGKVMAIEKIIITLQENAASRLTELQNARDCQECENATPEAWAATNPADAAELRALEQDTANIVDDLKSFASSELAEFYEDDLICPIVCLHHSETERKQAIEDMECGYEVPTKKQGVPNYIAQVKELISHCRFGGLTVAEYQFAKRAQRGGIAPSEVAANISELRKTSNTFFHGRRV